MAAAGAAIAAEAEFTLPAYMAGSVGIGVAVGALGYGAYRLRGGLLPHWNGAAARLAEVIMALGSVVLSAQLLGSVRSLHAAAVLVSAVLAGAVMAATGIVVGGRRAGDISPATGGAPARSTGPDPPPPERRGEMLAAGAAVVVLAAQWFAHTLKALAHGMTEPDTLWYHGPFAARFVQEQSFTGIDHLGRYPGTASSWGRCRSRARSAPASPSTSGTSRQRC